MFLASVNQKPLAKASPESVGGSRARWRSRAETVPGAAWVREAELFPGGEMSRDAYEPSISGESEKVGLNGGAAPPWATQSRDCA
jgi:hypothetical protein